MRAIFAYAVSRQSVSYFKLSLPESSVSVYPFCRLNVLAAEISLDERGLYSNLNVDVLSFCKY
jgi:hypothetical protein